MNCCNHALSQECVFHSPFLGHLSVVGILRQLTDTRLLGLLRKRELLKNLEDESLLWNP
jgi:hypothetical protein